MMAEEGLKVIRSRIFWVIIVAFSLFPVFLGLMLFVLKNPELARNSGLLGAKAEIMGEASWASYFNILSQVVAIAGLVGLGFVTSWIFGHGAYIIDSGDSIKAIPELCNFSQFHIILRYLLDNFIIFYKMNYRNS